MTDRPSTTTRFPLEPVHPGRLVLHAVSDEAGIERVARLAESIWLEHYTPMLGEARVRAILRLVQSLEAIRAEIDAGGRYHLMQPEAAPEPVGYLATRPDPSARALKLSKLYVERTHRRRGCARRAIEFVERQAKEAGAGAITLTVYPGNVEAIAFYQRLGFTHDGLVRRDFDGFVVDDVAMRKPV